MTLDTDADRVDDDLDAVAVRMQDAAALASSGKAWDQIVRGLIPPHPRYRVWAPARPAESLGK